MQNKTKKGKTMRGKAKARTPEPDPVIDTVVEEIRDVVYEEMNVMEGIGDLLSLLIAQGKESFKALGLLMKSDKRILVAEPRSIPEEDKRFHQSIVLGFSKSLLPQTRIISESGNSVSEKQMILRAIAEAEHGEPSRSARDLYLEGIGRISPQPPVPMSTTEKRMLKELPAKKSSLK